MLVDHVVDAPQHLTDQLVRSIGHSSLLLLVYSASSADGCRASAVTRMSMYGNSGSPLSSSCSSSGEATSKTLTFA